MGIVTLHSHIRDFIESIYNWKEVKKYREKWKEKASKKERLRGRNKKECEWI